MGIHEQNTGTGPRLLITQDWEYDSDFVRFLEQAAKPSGLVSVIVHAENLDEICHEIRSRKISPVALIDRASDTTPKFIRLQSILREMGVPIFDPVEQIRWASDKATMHLEFLTAHIPTPYTLILPPYEENDTPALHVDDLAHLGRSFVIKPANTTGGGMGVVHGAETLQDVLHARTEFQSDKYLIQEKVVPLEREGFRFWFRAFYAGGRVFVTWWNDRTHRYTLMESADFERFQLEAIPKLMLRIAQVALLSFFSSEIVYCGEGRWVVVDYINESCDMRLQSKYADGVPDSLVHQIAEALIQLAVSGNSGECI